MTTLALVTAHRLDAMALAMPAVADHPNRVPFHGVLTLVDAPSDRPPSGARGHRVLLTGKAVEEAIPSLLGMGLDYTPSLDRHDARTKIGVITSAELRTDDREDDVCCANRQARSGVRYATGKKPPRGLRAGHGAVLYTRRQQLRVGGHLYARDFPEVVRQIVARGRRQLGMSYEIADVHVADIEAPIWEVTRFTFTGAAVLLKDKAAYQGTWVELAH